MRTKICGIYKITSPSGKIYIGQSINIKGRCKSYNRVKCKSQPKLYSSLEKHGVENHIFEIIEECIQEQLNEREIHWIKHFDSFDSQHGMNLRSGGEQSLMSKESIKKMSEKAKGKPKSEEHKKNMSVNMMGILKSEDHKKNISLSKKGKLQSEEHSRNISISQKGNKYASGKRKVPFSEDAIKNMSEALKGNTNGSGNKGRTRTEEHSRNISISKKGKPQSEEHRKNNSKAQKGTKHSPERIERMLKTRKENRELKQRKIKSIVF